MAVSTASSSSPRLTVWCNGGFHGPALERLQEATAHVHLILDGRPESLAEADIAFGQPDEALVVSSPRLKWVHLTSAGYTRYDRDDVRQALRERGGILTNSSHVYDEPCAQHAFAFMLSLARQLPQALHLQQTRDWQSGPLRADSFLLNGQTVVFLGYGAIAKRLAQLIAPLQMRVIALRRSVPPGAEENGVEIIGESSLANALGQADHVMNILPESAATSGFVTADRLAQCKPGAFFYNIGRGATVDQAALEAALTSGQIGAAYLDVTTPEPLPPTHALWSAPNCFITPHSAGGHRGEAERLVRHFLSNLAAWERGQPCADRVF